MIALFTNKEIYIGYHEVNVYKKDDNFICFRLYVDQYFISTENNAILFYRYDEVIACIDLHMFDCEVIDDFK